MTNLELLDILGGVQGKYILEAQKMRTGSKKTHRFRYMRQLAAVIVLILMLTVFLNTAPGVAAVEYVKEKVTSLIEALFPPKKMTINIEGMEYEGDYVADGVEPEATAEAPQPGFAIYYDVDSYTMVKEGDITYIRPNLKSMTREEVLEIYGDYLSLLSEEERKRQIASLMNPQPDPSLPNCEIEIIHLDIPYEQVGCSGTLVKPLVRIEQCNLAIGQNALTTIILVALNIPIVSGSDAATRRIRVVSKEVPPSNGRNSTGNIACGETHFGLEVMSGLFRSSPEVTVNGQILKFVKQSLRCPCGVIDSSAFNRDNHCGQCFFPCHAILIT